MLDVDHLFFLVLKTAGTQTFFLPSFKSLCDSLLHHRVSSLLRRTEPASCTYSDEVDQSVVEVGAFGQEEAAAGTEVMEEEQILFLHDNKRSVLNII